MLWGCVVSSAFAYTTPTESWGYRPTYNQPAQQVFTVQFSTATVKSCGSPLVNTAYNPINGTVIGKTSSPSYNFRSTSVYNPVTSNARFTPIADRSASIAHGRIRKTGSWDAPDDEDDPIGQVPNPQPVGSPFIMLAMALLFVLYKRYYTRKSAR